MVEKTSKLSHHKNRPPVVKYQKNPVNSSRVFYFSSMRCPLLLLVILLLSLSSCQNKDTSSSIQLRSDRAAQLFLKSKETEEIELKLNFLDSALAEISEPDDTLKGAIYDHLIYYNYANKKLDSAKHFSDLLIDFGFTTDDTLQIAKGYYRKARILNEQNDQINVLKNSFQSQRYYLLSGDSLQAGRRLVEMSIAQTRLGDFPGSQTSAVKALSLLENTKDSIFLASAYNNLAATYRKLNDFDEAIEEYNNALTFVNTSRDSLAVINNMANIYAEKEEYKKSLKLLESIQSLAQNINFSNRIKDNYYFTQWLSDETDVADSLKLIMEARLQNNDLTGLLSSYDHLVRVNKKFSPNQAKKYAEAYYRTAEKLNSVPDEIRALNYLVSLSPPEESKIHALEYIRLNDSLMTARDHVKNLFAKIKYDEERKLEEIDQLEKISAQQQLEVLKRKNQRNMAILMGILILGSAVTIYFFVKQRHIKDKIREIHSTEARISKKIHDELANDVYNVMTELENTNIRNKESTLNKLESIYFRTRNISRENTPIPTGPNYQEDLHDMLSQSIPRKAKLYLLGFHEVSWSKISRESKVVIYRVLQELMVNMKKHSEASIVSLNFRETNSKLKFNYNDNGKGFSSADLKKGAGLINVENRIDSIGGSFNFPAKTNNGFSAQIIIPF